MTLRVNFDDPLVVSKGKLFDQAYIVIKNKKLFISQDTGMILRDDENTLLDYFPRQVLAGESAEALELQAIIVGKMFMALLVVQVLYTLCTVGRLHDFWRLYFAL